MDKTSATIIPSCSILAGESTLLSACTAVDLSRAVQCIFTVQATFNASTNDGLTVYFYPSTDGSTYDDTYWDSWTIKKALQVGYDAGTAEWNMGETVTAASGGTGTVIGWTISSGTFAGGDAAGNLYLEDTTGTFADNDTLTGSVHGAATENGTLSAHSIQRHYYPTSPTPLYLKAVIQNDGNQTITSALLKSTVMTL